ncbi:MAG: CDP-archaeol synthase [bacterium]|nr:CDP-archaeol synthase [bacterium]
MIINILYFLLPAAIANIGASVSSKIFPYWKYPMDFNYTFRGHRVLGDHKTIRGFICGTLTGFIVYLIQIQLYTSVPPLKNISLIDYSATPIYFGMLLSAGALIGDALKSFFKRQTNIPSGKSWIPFDQTDWVIGSLLLTSVIIPYTPLFILLAMFIGLCSHFIVKVIGYLLKIEKAPI